MPPDLEGLIALKVAGSAPAEDVGGLGRELAACAGPALQALLFFGSRRSGAATDVWSAYDLVVVVDAYRPFYDALKQAGVTRRSSGFMAVLSTLLPPTQINFPSRGTSGLRAKCSVISASAFARETAPGRHDHFCAARLFQPTQLVHARDAGARALALSGVVAAHRATFDWSRPWLPETFDAAEYTRRLLEVSLRAEIRPESAGRAGQLWEAQREYLLEVYAAVLDELARSGQLEAVAPGRYRLALPVSRARRLRTWLYFRTSLARTTLRWGKHMLSFEGWLDYIVQKVARHGGGAMTLSARERRWPLLFLWPRVIRYLRAKRRTGGART